MNADTPEFSRLLSVARIPPKGSLETLEAKPAEREALSARFELVSLNALTATLNVMPNGHETFAVTGTMNAEFVQNCILTLEPITTRLTIDIDVVFSPLAESTPGETIAEMDELEEEIDTYSGGKIDLGELVAQQLGINIDPYPRKDGAALSQTEFGPKIEKPRPFSGISLEKSSNKNKD